MPFKFSTADPCECDWLQRAAAEPQVPIRYNEQLNEYQVSCDGSAGRGSMPIRYCPFCGGAAPSSRRPELFTRLTHAELGRLAALTDALKTVQAVLDAFGPPDEDLDHGDGTIKPATGDSPPVAERFRTLVYYHLSETAVIRASERADGRVRFAFTGKHIASRAGKSNGDGEPSSG